MSHPPLPIDRHDAKESGKSIQHAQDSVIEAGTLATIALIREILKHLKLPEKPVSVQIEMNDSVAFKANAKGSEVVEAANSLSEEQMRYLKEVIKLPESNEPAATSIPLDKDVTITVDGKAVFRLKDGIVEKNLLTPAAEQVREKPAQEIAVPAKEAELEETPAQEAQVEVIQGDVPELKQAGVTFSDGQRQELQKLGVNPQAIENAVGQNTQGTVPIIVVLNREVERNVPKSALKDNLKSMLASFQSAARDLSSKVTSLLGAVRERFFPSRDRSLEQDIQNLAAVNVTSQLLDRFGGKTQDGKEVFEGNSFRLEREANNLSVNAKDGRGTILSLKDGILSGSLTQKDLAKFQSVNSQLSQGQSRQSQAEWG